MVPGGNVSGVLAAFGAIEDSARAAMSFDNLDDMHTDSGPICVIELPDAVVVVENNGFQGSRADVLGPASRASRASTASSFFWNVNAVTAFSAARRGEVLFSPTRAAIRATGQLPRPLTEDERDAAVRADLAAAVRGDFREWQQT